MDAGPCGLYSWQGAALGSVSAIQPCAVAQSPTGNKADLDLSLWDLTVERRGHTSKLAVKLGQLKGVTARLDTAAWKRLGG